MGVAYGAAGGRMVPYASLPTTGAGAGPGRGGGVRRRPLGRRPALRAGGGGRSGRPDATLEAGRQGRRVMAVAAQGAVTTQSEETLVALDHAHLLHPQHHPADHAEPVIFARGAGAILWDVQGRRYIDGLSCLW